MADVDVIIVRGKKKEGEQEKRENLNRGKREYIKRKLKRKT